MKNPFFLLALPFLLALGACSSRVAPTQEARVISDCTGMYLQINGKDYLVCNRELLKGKEGQLVKASFEKIEKCPEFKDKVVCLMYHENEGMIRILKLE